MKRLALLTGSVAFATVVYASEITTTDNEQRDGTFKKDPSRIDQNLGDDSYISPAVTSQVAFRVKDGASIRLTSKDGTIVEHVRPRPNQSIVFKNNVLPAVSARRHRAGGDIVVKLKSNAGHRSDVITASID